jgi:hypothetical protein
MYISLFQDLQLQIHNLCRYGEEIINLPAGTAAVWGVSAVPPGMSKEEGDLYRSMNDQQSR